MESGRGLHRGQIGELVVGVAAVHAEIVGAPAAAIHRNHAGIVAAVEKIGTGLRLHTGLQLQQLVSIAGIQRQLGNRALVHHRAHLGAGGLDQRRFAGDLDDFLGAADLQGGIQSDHLVDLDHYVLLHILLEAARLELHPVGARRHLNQNVVAAVAGQALRE